MAVQKNGQTLVITTEEEEQRIIESCGLDSKRLKEITDTVLDWCSQEEHLHAAVPYLAKTKFVERQVLLAKGSVEESKMRVDRLLKTRAVLPELCLNRSLFELESVFKYVHFFQLPKLCPKDLSRVFIAQFLPVESYEDYDSLLYFKYLCFIIEYTYTSDINVYDRYILDFKHLKLSFLGKINLSAHKKMEKFAMDGHGGRVKGIHVLNAPGFIDKLLYIVKSAMKPKVADRICIHKTVEDLHEIISKEIMPQDYGGDEASGAELYERWRTITQAEEATQKLKDLENVVSDESKRINTKLDEEQLGMPGSFRKLDLD